MVAKHDLGEWNWPCCQSVWKFLNKFCKIFDRKWRKEGYEGRYGTVTCSQLINVECVASLLEQITHIIEAYMRDTNKKRKALFKLLKVFTKYYYWKARKKHCCRWQFRICKHVDRKNLILAPSGSYLVYQALDFLIIYIPLVCLSFIL